MPKKLTHEFVEKAYLDGGIKLLSEYVNSTTKNKLECIKCDHQWKAIYSSFCRGARCPKCAGVNRRKKQAFSHEFVYKKYLKRNIKLLSKYINANTRNNVICLICDHSWKSVYRDFSQGKGCSKCSDKISAKKRRLPQKFIEKEYMKENITLLSEYKSNATKNRLECGYCNHIWYARYDSFKRGRKCPNCAPTGFNPTKPAYQYIFKLDIHEGIFYKIGICNTGNLEDRKKSVHKQCKIISKTYFEIGKDAQIEESRLHKLNAKHRVNLKGIVANGHTEFFDIPPLI